MCQCYVAIAVSCTRCRRTAGAWMDEDGKWRRCVGCGTKGLKGGRGFWRETKVKAYLSSSSRTARTEYESVHRVRTQRLNGVCLTRTVPLRLHAATPHLRLGSTHYTGTLALCSSLVQQQRLLFLDPSLTLTLLCSVSAINNVQTTLSTLCYNLRVRRQ